MSHSGQNKQGGGQSQARASKILLGSSSFVCIFPLSLSLSRSLALSLALSIAFSHSCYLLLSLSLYHHYPFQCNGWGTLLFCRYHHETSITGEQRYKLNLSPTCKMMTSNTQIKGYIFIKVGKALADVFL